MPDATDMQQGFVMGAPNRCKILKALGKMNNATPTQLSQKTRLLTTNVSRALKELESENLIKCTTYSLRKGKLFTLTEQGRTILQRITRPSHPTNN